MIKAKSRSAIAGAVPFRGAEEAWFWTASVLLARQDGAGLAWRPDYQERPCDPEDIVAYLDVLYRQQSLTLAHARVIRQWGALQQAPEATAGASVPAVAPGHGIAGVEAASTRHCPLGL